MLMWRLSDIRPNDEGTFVEIVLTKGAQVVRINADEEQCNLWFIKRHIHRLNKRWIGLRKASKKLKQEALADGLLKYDASIEVGADESNEPEDVTSEHASVNEMS